jgi:hypothetical protein
MFDWGECLFFANTTDEGYPLKKDETDLAEWLEKELIERDFNLSWGTGNGNTWDFMAAIIQYSYLTAYKMIPSEKNPGNLDWDSYLSLNTGYSFDDYSKYLLIDAINSISKVWLRVWIKYPMWVNR